MKHGVYTIFDADAASFLPPFHMATDGLAVRIFQDSVNSPEPNNISKHPESFSLFKLGTFDDQAAIFDLKETPKRIALGVELITDTTPRYTNVDMSILLEAIRQIKTRPLMDRELEVLK